MRSDNRGQKVCFKSKETIVKEKIHFESER